MGLSWWAAIFIFHISHTVRSATEPLDRADPLFHTIRRMYKQHRVIVERKKTRMHEVYCRRNQDIRVFTHYARLYLFQETGNLSTMLRKSTASAINETILISNAENWWFEMLRLALYRAQEWQIIDGERIELQIS